MNGQVLVDGRCRGECAIAALPFIDERSFVRTVSYCVAAPLASAFGVKLAEIPRGGKQVIIHDWSLEEEGPMPMKGLYIAAYYIIFTELVAKAFCSLGRWVMKLEGFTETSSGL